MPSAAVRPWQQALRPDAVFFRLSEALDSCAAAVSPQEDQQQRRVWAVDLACGRSTGPAPKFFVVATPAVFVDAYLAFSDRHAYEVVDSTRGCFLYFDLEQNFWSAAELAQAQEAGRRVADTAAVVLAELAALRDPEAPSPPLIDVLALDATRPIEAELAGKYSAHLVCRMWRDGAPWLLRGPADAGAVARRLSERLIEEGHTHAAALIDLAVYGDRRPFRLLGSTKLTDARSRPLQLLDGGGAPLSAADVLASLVAPAIQPAILPPAAIPSAAQSSRPRMRPAPALTRHTKAPRRDGAVAHGRWWPRHTEMPLLDTPRLPHHTIARRLAGTAQEVPEPLQALYDWATEQLARCSGGAAMSWRYERASSPEEALLHITGDANGVCAHIGREHTSWHVMVSVDILNGLAWQRCWDHRCVRVVAADGAYVKAKHALGAVPVECLPSRSLVELGL
jgi:hypothetical protein